HFAPITCQSSQTQAGLHHVIYQDVQAEHYYHKTYMQNQAGQQYHMAHMFNTQGYTQLNYNPFLPQTVSLESNVQYHSKTSVFENNTELYSSNQDQTPQLSWAIPSGSNGSSHNTKVSISEDNSKLLSVIQEPTQVVSSTEKWCHCERCGESSNIVSKCWICNLITCLKCNILGLKYKLCSPCLSHWKNSKKSEERTDQYSDSCGQISVPYYTGSKSNELSGSRASEESAPSQTKKRKRNQEGD
ncbi:unnamed protein product, partial [Owenia fusiformis]